MRTTSKILIILSGLILFTLRPAVSYADHWHHRDGGHHSHFDLSFSFFPWYYHDDYVLVSPAVVNPIPVHYQTVYVNGVSYYVNNGNYYLYDGYGYQLVSPPVTVVQPAPVLAAAPAQVTSVSATPETENSFTLNIPNDQGGYTAVTIRRSGNGFIGPQGEFYSEFPKVSQLKLMYAK